MKHRLTQPTGSSVRGWAGSDTGRRVFLKGIGIVCLGSLPLLQACDTVMSWREKSSATAKAETHSRAVIPPIDAAAPGKTATATFALG